MGGFQCFSLCKAVQVAGSTVRLLRSQATNRPAEISSCCSQTAPAHLPQPNPVHRGVTAPTRGPSGSPLLTATPYESSHSSSFLQNHLPLNKSSQTLSSLLPPAPVAFGLFSGPRCHPLHPPKTPVLEFQHLQPRLALPGSFESPPVKTRSETTGSFCDFTGPGF